MCPPVGLTLNLVTGISYLYLQLAASYLAICTWELLSASMRVTTHPMVSMSCYRLVTVLELRSLSGVRDLLKGGRGCKVDSLDSYRGVGPLVDGLSLKK
jgi:hypothetical protein